MLLYCIGLIIDRIVRFESERLRMQKKCPVISSIKLKNIHIIACYNNIIDAFVQIQMAV